METRKLTVLLLALLPTVAAQVQIVIDLGDATANDRGLTSFGFPSAVSAEAAKFGQGLKLDGIDDYLAASPSALGSTGDVSLFIRFSLDSLHREHQLIAFGGFGEVQASNTLYALYFAFNNTLCYFNEFDGGNESLLCGGTASTGEHSIVLRRAANTTVVKLDAVTVINAAHTGANGGTSALFSIGRVSDRPFTSMAGNVLEARVWTTAVAQATLDSIAATTGSSTNEGTEAARWPLDAEELDAGTSDAATGIVNFMQRMGFENPGATFFFGLVLVALFMYVVARSVLKMTGKPMPVFGLAAVGLGGVALNVLMGIWPLVVTVLMVVAAAMIFTLVVVRVFVGGAGGGDE